MNKAQKIILISLCCVFLCACQIKKPEAIDNTSYSLATNAGNRMQPTKLVPVPMPGQLMSLKTKSSKQLVGEAAIDEANKKSIKQPSSNAYINSIMTFDYMQGALYQIYSAPLSVTDVQFQANEHIIAVGAGDALRWLITKTYSGGAGASRQEHLLIKPTDEGLTTSLVVTTDQRTYHIMLHSTPKTYMASVTWRYPNSDNLLTNFEDEEEENIPDITGGVDVNRLAFIYEVKLLKGPVPDWYPKVVFTDGNKTYIKFSSQAQDTPSLFIGDNKKSEVVSFRVQGNYYIVDKVFYKAQLRGNLSVVQISMKKK